MSIDPTAYRGKEAFRREMRTLFSERFFVGSIHTFPEIDSYRSFVLEPKVITVRRTSEGIRAFSNVCLHRSNVIDPIGEGKRHFSCRFHGWSYSAEGRLGLTPFADAACIQRNQLAAFPVSQSNDLLFISSTGTPAPTDKVDAAFEKTRFTTAKGFASGQLIHKCNWKLLVDNALESYHLNFVHRETFLVSGFNSTSTHSWHGDGYINCASITPLPATSKLKALQRFAQSASHCYRHAYIFPNLFLSNTNDLVGYLASIVPIDETTTALNWELMELPAMSALPEAVRVHIRNESIAFAQQTLEEDRVMVEGCQLGLMSDDASIQLQPVEDRVIHFHDYYLERINRAAG